MDGVSLPWVYVYSAIYEMLFGVVVLQRSIAPLEVGGGISLPWVYVHSAIYETYLV